MGPCPLNLQDLVNWDLECHGSVSSEPSEPCELRPGMPWVCVLWAFRTLWTETWNAMGPCPLSLQNLVNWDLECHGSVSSEPSEPCGLRPGMPWVCVLWAFRTLWTETWMLLLTTVPPSDLSWSRTSPWLEWTEDMIQIRTPRWTIQVILKPSRLKLWHMWKSKLRD